MLAHLKRILDLKKQQHLTNNNPHLIVNHFFIGSSAGSPVISGGESGGSERDGVCMLIRLEELGEKQNIMVIISQSGPSIGHC